MRLLALTLLLALPALAAAQRATPAAAPASTAQQTREAEQKAAFAEAMQHAQRGPANLALAGQAHLRLPQGTAWVPPPYAQRVLRSMGDSAGDGTLGLIFGRAPGPGSAQGRGSAQGLGGAQGHTWASIVTYVHGGHVMDDEQNKLDASALLSQLRDGQEEDNKDRIARGFPGLELTGWLQPPVYNAATHRLTWALLVTEAGQADSDATVNYNTRNLGRDGLISVNMLTSRSNFAVDARIAETLLTGFAYDQGRGYSDFDPHTDHVAAYGLAALIGVVALKKLGLIAVATGFVLKFAKLGVLAAAAAMGAARRLFRRKPVA
jgi:uncharacterized membrane-anchored protein